MTRGVKQTAKKHAKPGHVRIIGGQWRGRKLPVARTETLRPSPDRVRETLFNWLTPYLDGARCLDLFAGTGALGFEAVSRGAAAATLIDNNSETLELLHQQVDVLNTSNVQIVADDALSWLRTGEPTPFDIIFLDPPFGQHYLEPSLDALQRGWLKHRSLVYLEAENIPILHLETSGWLVARQGQTRQVKFALVKMN